MPPCGVRAHRSGSMRAWRLCSAVTLHRCIIEVFVTLLFTEHSATPSFDTATTSFAETVQVSMLQTIRSAHKVCLRALPRYAAATLLLILAAGLETTALHQANASEGLPEASINEGQIRARPAQT